METEASEELTDAHSGTTVLTAADYFRRFIIEDLVKQIALRKPLRAVFRDSGFESDN